MCVEEREHVDTVHILNFQNEREFYESRMVCAYLWGYILRIQIFPGGGGEEEELYAYLHFVVCVSLS